MVKYSFLSEFAIQVLNQHHRLFMKLCPVSDSYQDLLVWAIHIFRHKMFKKGFAEVSLKVFESTQFCSKGTPETLVETTGIFDMLQAGMQCSFS